VFVDVGALWGVRRPETLNIIPGSDLTRVLCTNPDGSTELLPYGSTGSCTVTGAQVTRGAIAPFQERFVGNTPSPRLSVGIGVNWNSPFGPFRVDIAHALLSEEGDDTKLFSFNVGTAF
jgi:outer membrane protein insertion porin family